MVWLRKTIPQAHLINNLLPIPLTVSLPRIPSPCDTVWSYNWFIHNSLVYGMLLLASLMLYSSVTTHSSWLRQCTVQLHGRRHGLGILRHKKTHRLSHLTLWLSSEYALGLWPALRGLGGVRVAGIQGELQTRIKNVLHIVQECPSPAHFRIRQNSTLSSKLDQTARMCAPAHRYFAVQRTTDHRRSYILIQIRSL